MLKIFFNKRFAAICLFCLSCVACGKKQAPAPPPPRPARPAQPVAVPEIEQPEKYVYQGYKNRNPFFMMGGGQSRSASDSEPVSTDAAGFRLSGIMTDSSGIRYALIADASGGSYILKNGWLYDEEGKRVPAVTGTVFEDRIIIISGTTMKELKLPADDLPAKLE